MILAAAAAAAAEFLLNFPTRGKSKKAKMERFLLHLLILESPLEITGSFEEVNLLTVSLALMYSCRHTQRHCLYLT